MKRILLPTDFSPTSEKAFRFALNIAARAQGTIMLYHTYIALQSSFIGTEESRKQYNAGLEADIVKRLERLSKKIASEFPDVTVSTMIGRSPLVENMLDYATQNQIDLIVMGTQGATGLKKTIIGSVAAEVIERSPLPVLLIPAKYEPEALRQFVFATNFHPSEKAAFSFLDAMEKLFNAQTTVLHFVSDRAAISERTIAENKFDTLVSSIREQPGSSKIKFELVETASVTDTMETLENKFPYDIMMMVRQKKTFLEQFFIKSLTKNMAYITTKPLLVVPAE